MKLEISVPEIVEVINEVAKGPEGIFGMIRMDLRERVGDYLSGLMEAELTHYLGRAPYERGKGKVDYRNGSYKRRFGLKGIGEVEVRVPRDRQGTFRTRVIPKSKRYEEAIRQEVSFLFLTGIGTRSLSMLSKRLIGVKLSPSEISRAN